MATRTASGTWLTDEMDAAPPTAMIRDGGLLQRVFDAMPQPILVIDADNCQVVLSNAAAGAGPVQGAVTCHLFSHGRVAKCDDSADAPCPLEQVKREKRPVTVEHIHYDRRGRPHFVEVRAFPLFDELGVVRHVVEMSRGVTPERVAVREREHLISQLRDALRATKPQAGLVPICASCKRVRDSAGDWHEIEAYLEQRAGVECSHSICPDCAHATATGHSRRASRPT